MRQTQHQVVFNRGRISKLGLGRIDLSRTSLSAEIQTNWVPRVLGSMMVRPGLGYVGTINNSSTGRLLPFIVSATDAVLLELTSTNMRIWQDDALVVRTGSTSAITNGTFTSTTGWTNTNESSGAHMGIISTDGNYLLLVGTKYSRAGARQKVTSSSGTHGLFIEIDQGPVIFRCGSSTGGDDYFNETALRSGYYSLGITSTGEFFIEFSNDKTYAVRVGRVGIESSGFMSLETTWAGADLDALRHDQSGDVLFVANSSYRQHRIERYSSDSWGIAKYEPVDGPYRAINLDKTKLTPHSPLLGTVTVDADRRIFKSGHLGALFRLTSVGQEVNVKLNAAEQWSDSIRVAGVENDRIFTAAALSATSVGFTGTIRLQRSVGDEDTWVNSSTGVFTSSGTQTIDDGLDNQVVYYRIGIGATDFVGSGVPTAQLKYSGGGKVGVGQVVSVNGATSVEMRALTEFGSTIPTDLWEEGEWSNYRGWPSAVTLHEGRLWWAGKQKIWGSVSDAFESFDPDVEGDSGPLNRAIAYGGSDKIQNMASLGRLIIQTGSREIQVKTGSLEEPLTPTNFNLRDISGQGSASVPSAKIDNASVFIQRGGARVMEIAYSDPAIDYKTGDLTVLVPEIGETSISRTAVQRQPDTRVHCVRSTGTVGLLVTDPGEETRAWVDINSTAANGAIEDVAVLPGTVEDKVYYLVRREINGSTYRFLEKWGMESQARGGSSNRMADSNVVYNGTATTVIPATHLVGSSVVAWGATADLGAYTVSSTGTITLSQAATYACVGLPYEAWYKSAKLAYATEQGTALLQAKRVSQLGLLMADVHAQGIKHGPSTASTDLEYTPLVEQGTTISTDVVNQTYDEATFPFNGEWDTDSRVVLYGKAPRPATVLGMVMQIDTEDKK